MRMKIKERNLLEIQKITQVIQKKYQPEKIILFGSFAYGNPKLNSDIDLVVIKSTKERFLDRLKKIAYLIDSDLGTDILVYTPQEWQKEQEAGNYFVKEIEAKGKIIYERK